MSDPDSNLVQEGMMATLGAALLLLPPQPPAQVHTCIAY